MRIAHLSSAHAAFDVRIFHKECRTLARAGHDVAFIVPHEHDETRDGVRLCAVPRPANRRSRFALAITNVARRALAFDADVYHLHDPELLTIVPLLKASGGKVVYDVHENVPGQIRRKRWIPSMLRPPVSTIVAAVEQLFARGLLDRIVAATPAIAARFPATKTVIIQNFPLVGELASHEARQARQLRPTATYVGAISANRGAREMVRAMGHLSDLEPRLVLAGRFSPPSLEPELRGLPEWRFVDYLGLLPRPEVAAVLAQANVGLVVFHPEPNHVDAQPNKLFEYMSASLPIVASDFPLWRQIVLDSQAGIMVDPLDDRDIAAAIREIVAQPELAMEMGRAGSAAVAETYNWGREAAKLIALYEDLAR